ncbi:MAG: OmpA family protein [Victivallaceae bacterium]
MIRKNIIRLLILAIPLSFSSCARSSSEVWEDTKVCSKYMKKGFGSLLGVNKKNKHQRTFSFVPLYEDELPIAKFTSSADMQEEEVLSLNEPTRSPFEKITFDTDSYTIKGEHHLRYLQEIVNYMVKYPKVRLIIEGHTDERGTASYNLALGVRRANSVKNFLIKKGISPDRILPVSYGKERPVAMEHNEVCWRQNRRTEFKLNAK